MDAATRAAVAGGREAFRSALAEGDKGELAQHLFAVVELLDENSALRRALTDVSREGSQRSGLADQILSGRVSGGAQRVVATLASQRWSHERDLVDAVERYGVEAVIASAEDKGQADETEEQLFRFERIVASDSNLRGALTDPRAPKESRAQLVDSLLGWKASAETIALAKQAVTAPRGRRFDRAIEEFLEVASRRREQLTALVTSAIVLDEAQRERLRAALAKTYGQGVRLNTVVDPRVLGGIRVEIDGEVVDGTILRRLDGARRGIAG